MFLKPNIGQERVNKFPNNRRHSDSKKCPSFLYGNKALEWLEQFSCEKNDTPELWTTVDMATQDLIRESKTISIVTVKSLIIIMKNGNQSSNVLFFQMKT